MRFHFIDWDGKNGFVLLFNINPYEEKQVNVNELGFHCYEGTAVVIYEKSLILLEDVIKWIMK